MRVVRLTTVSLIAALLLVAPHTGWSQESIADPSATSKSAPLSDQGMPPAPPEDRPIASQVTARLSDVEGSVRLSDKTGKAFDQALQNMAVLPGMTVETGNDGRAELEFPDGSVARVTPNSSIAIAGPDAAARGRLILQPLKGLTYYELSREFGSNVVQVGPLVARASRNGSGGSSLLRVNLDASPYQAAVLRGTVHFEDATGNAAYDLETNQTARIDPAAATNYDLVFDLTPDSWDAWNADRDSTRAQIASAAAPAGQSAGPGWDDLNYYGSWYDVPGQGMAWAPDGVGENFDPYASGAWGYYSGVGYGWVSSYPWGWLPYHCGLWNYYQSYGWMWLPASCGWGPGSGWYPYAGVRNVPTHYRGPSPPHGIYPVGRAPRLIAVHQGTPVHFRAVGEPRPVARALVVSGVPVQPAPVQVRPSYRAIAPASGLRSDETVTGGTLEPGQIGYGTRGRVIVPAPGSGYLQSAPRVTSVPRPQVYVPQPRISTPPQAPMSAPHVLAAPAAPAGHGH